MKIFNFIRIFIEKNYTVELELFYKHGIVLRRTSRIKFYSFPPNSTKYIKIFDTVSER